MVKLKRYSACEISKYKKVVNKKFKLLKINTLKKY
ncbi:hypothetical protein PMI10_03636 [Flavobacterium sp. CF136]|nr:hypothetical protein PMI10_03636 [Flavobacterium sp. CF136]